MVGYHPVDVDYLGLGMAKFVHGGAADDQRKSQVIFFTRPSQLRTSGLQHHRPANGRIESKKSLPRGGGPTAFVSS
jgi:hypothetical protein